jgi:hypothetical protein
LYHARVDDEDFYGWSEWVFRCVFEEGGRRVVRVFAACEYDAWVSFTLLTGIEVNLDGLEHW